MNFLKDVKNNIFRNVIIMVFFANVITFVILFYGFQSKYWYQLDEFGKIDEGENVTITIWTGLLSITRYDTVNGSFWGNHTSMTFPRFIDDDC